MTTINIELKNIKHMASLSEETNCYSATVYLDGKPVCDVSNHGHGGCDMQHWRDRAAEATITAYFKSLPERDTGMELHGKPFMVQPDLEGWCGDQVTRFLISRDIKRSLKRKVIVVGPDGKEYGWNLKPDTLNIETNFRDKGRMTGAAYILSKSEPGSVILNTLPPAALEVQIDRLIAAAH